MVIAGLRLDTAGKDQGSGPRWHAELPYPRATPSATPGPVEGRAASGAREALADASRPLQSLDRPPLAPLPRSGDGLAVLHAAAEETLQERRRAETGRGWLRPFTPGGVGAPPWEAASKRQARARSGLEGTKSWPTPGD